jgi:hypothetical protein
MSNEINSSGFRNNLIKGKISTNLKKKKALKKFEITNSGMKPLKKTSKIK